MSQVNNVQLLSYGYCCDGGGVELREAELVTYGWLQGGDPQANHDVYVRKVGGYLETGEENREAEGVAMT